MNGQDNIISHSDLEMLVQKIVTEMTKPKRRGRPQGKSSSPAWKPRTVQFKTETYNRVRILLMENEAYKDISELIDSIIMQWIDAGGKVPRIENKGDEQSADLP